MASALSEIETFEDIPLDPAVLRRLAPFATARPISFHLPGFKRYASSELPACGKAAWPAVSVTGSECRLLCDHCRGALLTSMLPATTPDALWRLGARLAEEGRAGMLLSGGSDARGEVPLAPFLPVVARLKAAYPAFGIAVHTGLLDAARAAELAQSGADTAMLDLIGAEDTVRAVYHLDRPVADFEAALAALVASGMRVVPHIVMGLHYGHFLGEWRALEMVARQRPAALVLVAAMPLYASARRPFDTPSARAVGAFFATARETLADTPLLLGCARPAGAAKQEMDAYAVLAGFDGIAHPAEGVVALARRLGREARVSPGCCALAPT
jgi:uncharacterized radical SAM superfamily protein